MSTVKSLRQASGLSQAELATRASVTRQLISAIEAGRHSPSVDAALRIARALGSDVETVFGAAEESAVPVVLSSSTTPAVPGTPCLVSRVGSKMVCVPVRNLLGVSESWAYADGVFTENGVDLYSGIDDTGLMVAGCDPLLGLISAALKDRRASRIVSVHLSTGAAISALRDGLVHGVVVHGPSDSLPTPPVDVHRWRFASWRVGLATAQPNVSLEELADRQAEVAQRETGAGTQRALDRALATIGAPSLPGPMVHGHLEAARHVVAGVAGGITIEAAARAFQLGFIALETHFSELWIDDRYVHHRGAVALVEELTDAATVARARNLPGYDLSNIGTRLVA
jgi:transcriptional regulator with XRE-family HTH domain